MNDIRDKHRLKLKDRIISLSDSCYVVTAPYVKLEITSSSFDVEDNLINLVTFGYRWQLQVKLIVK